MTSYVLGVQPVAPGYATFTPHFGTLTWAQGTVPTPFGQIFVSWQKYGDKYSVTVQAPPGTTASVVLPGGTSVTVRGGANGAQQTLVG